MGCDYSTNLKDIVVKEGRLYKFCKIRFNPLTPHLATKKRMEMIETDAGGSNSYIMLWEKELHENKDDPHFLKSFFNEVDAIIIEYSLAKKTEESELKDLSFQVNEIIREWKHKIIPVFVFSKSMNTNTALEKANQDMLTKAANAYGWQVINMSENEREEARVRQVSHTVFKMGILPKRMGPERNASSASFEQSAFEGYPTPKQQQQPLKPLNIADKKGLKALDIEVRNKEQLQDLRGLV